MGTEIVLIHGWDPRFYSNRLNLATPDAGIAWSNRTEFVNLLKGKFDVRYFNLPGFCGKTEPNSDFYDIENFSQELNKWLSDEKIKPVAVVGYSFGGAVALNHKIRYNSEFPVILISPALSRNESVFSDIGNKTKFVVPDFARERLKSAYQSIFSKYYRLGTQFIKKSYDHIVRRDISKDLMQVNPEEVMLIYGNKDTATPWKNVESIVRKIGINYVLIDGGHNIGQTNGREIFDSVSEFLK